MNNLSFILPVKQNVQMWFLEDVASGDIGRAAQKVWHLLLAIIVLTGREENRLLAWRQSAHSTDRVKVVINLQQLSFNVRSVALMLPCAKCVEKNAWGRKERDKSEQEWG